MKKSTLYLTLAGAFIITASIQSKMVNFDIPDTTKTAALHTDSTAEVEFVDESIEKYAEYDSKSELYAVFGKENIKDGVWNQKNSETHFSSELTDPRNGKIYNYVWNKDGESLYMIEAHYRVIRKDDTEKQRQIIDFKNGIFTGMLISELEEWNGTPFSFAGLSLDRGGYVNFGKFADKRIIVKVGLDESLKTEIPKAIKKNKQVLSNAASIQELPMFVDYIALKVN